MGYPYRKVVEIKQPKRRDPRFDPLAAGQFDQALFDQSYSFLDEKRDSEIEQLKKAVLKEKKRRKGRQGGEESKIEQVSHGRQKAEVNMWL